MKNIAVRRDNLSTVLPLATAMTLARALGQSGHHQAAAVVDPRRTRL